MRAGVFALLLLLAASCMARAQDAPTIIAADRDAEPDGYRYEPARLEVAPGALVTVVARGDEPHTLTPLDAGAFTDTRVEVGGRATLIAPTEPGEYRYYCRFHATPETTSAEGMAGALVVREAATTPPPTAQSEPATTPAGGFAVLGVALACATVLLGRRR